MKCRDDPPICLRTTCIPQDRFATGHCHRGIGADRRLVLSVVVGLAIGLVVAGRGRLLLAIVHGVLPIAEVEAGGCGIWSLSLSSVARSRNSARLSQILSQSCENEAASAL